MGDTQKMKTPEDKNWNMYPVNMNFHIKSDGKAEVRVVVQGSETTREVNLKGKGDTLMEALFDAFKKDAVNAFIVRAAFICGCRCGAGTLRIGGGKKGTFHYTPPA